MAATKVRRHRCKAPGCRKLTENPQVCSKRCAMLFVRERSSASDTGPRPHRRTSAECRFFRFVQEKPKRPSECWIWYGHYSSGGRPLIWGGMDNPKQVSATRLSYEIYKGEIPPGYVVVSTCQNKKCVNPIHLICGPRGEMVAKIMRINKKVARYGDENKSSKLTDAEVAHIRKLHSERRFKEIKAIARSKGMHEDYVVSIGRSKGRLRRRR